MKTPNGRRQWRPGQGILFSALPAVVIAALFAGLSALSLLRAIQDYDGINLPQVADTTAEQVGGTASGVKPESMPGRSLAELHLFGARATVAQPKPDRSQVKPTNLKLSLRGVVGYSAKEGKASAVIVGPGGEEGVYHLGSPVPGGATLIEIGREQVLLERKGQVESLLLDEGNRSSSEQLARRPGAVTLPMPQVDLPATIFPSLLPKNFNPRIKP